MEDEHAPESKENAFSTPCHPTHPKHRSPVFKSLSDAAFHLATRLAVTGSDAFLTAAAARATWSLMAAAVEAASSTQEDTLSRDGLAMLGPGGSLAA